MSIVDKSLEDLLREAAEEKQIQNKERTGHTAQNLRTQILVHGVHMIEKLQTSIYNKDEDISAEQQRSYEMLWPVISDIISKTDDLKIVEAKTASDVIEAVAKGKITMKDALILMSLIQSKTEIEELPKLIAKLDESSE